MPYIKITVCKKKKRIVVRFNVRYFLVCELRERGERTWTTPLIKNTFVGFFVSTPPFFFPPSLLVHQLSWL